MYSPIKWTGSKRLLARYLVPLFPERTKVIDPFVGGGTLLQYYAVEGVVGDSNRDLINLWHLIQSHPYLVGTDYRKRWEKFQVDHGYYYVVRDEYNETHSPLSLLFLTRTCAAGVIRYNSNDNFNSPVHHTRPGLHPDRMDMLLKKWQPVVRNYRFVHQDYWETLQEAGDFVFLDPPYCDSSGAVYKPGVFNYQELWEELERLNTKGVKWMLTFGVEDDVPEIYEQRLVFAGGKSLLRNSKDSEAVKEAVYLNY